MTIDKSLRSRTSLRRHRNVLGRAERLLALKDAGRWHEGQSVFGLPKVRTARVRRRVKAKAAAKPGAPAPAEAAVPAAEAKTPVAEKKPAAPDKKDTPGKKAGKE